MSGKVTLSVQDDVHPAARDSARVRVYGRGWWSIDRILVRDSFVRGAYLQTDFRPGNVVVLGANASAGGSLSFDDIFEGDSTANHPTTAVLEEIVEGPNQGYWYVAGHDYRVDRRWHVNKRLDSLKGPEDLPDAANGDTVNHWTYLARRGHDPADLLAGVTGSKKAPFTEPAADTQDADPKHTHPFCNWKAF